HTPADTGVIALSSTYSDRIAEATAKTFEIDRFLPADRLQDVGIVAKSIIDPSSRRQHRTSVLVIEDYEDTAELIDRILKQRFHIERAHDGEAGLKQWLEGQHDIVLLDLMLPKMSGEAVLAEILKHKPNQSVIIMTAHGDAEKAGELIEKGAVDFIAKPFKAEQLRHVCNIAAQREDFIISNDQFKAKQNALTEARGSAQVTLESIADGVITTDREGKIGYMNPVAQAILGWTLEEVINKPIQHFFKTYHRVSRIPTASFVKRVLIEETAIRSTTTSILRNRNDEELIIDQQAAPIKDHDGVTTGAVLIFHDQTEAQHLEQQLSFHANHDPVTGLQVRSMFDQELRLAIHECNQDDSSHALCQLDILQFKMINDTCGRHAGDKLLQQIAQTLKDKVKAPSDMITRLGGDEFGFLLRHCPIESAQQICEIICQEISSQAFEWEGKRFEINVGIGIAPISSHSHELSDVVYAAGTACNMAKERGKNRVQVYSDKDDVVVEKRSEILLATELMDALKDDNLCLFQQKIQNVDTNGKDCFEVLLRIVDKEGKLKTPAPYLNAAERYKLTPN
ncbi:diguanylate cyclase, partial [bacterium]|nr:diguanylate cyclase [bacterium]